ncbi:MAG: hypothetical protein IJT82_08455 [Schwartzia sp.]|nr:hypothetical protein [Schwartzia sp. (in: firmicutes)]
MQNDDETCSDRDSSGAFVGVPRGGVRRWKRKVLGGGTANPAASSAVSVPNRAPVSTPPTTTFKFGEHEAKVYDLKGIDLKQQEITPNFGHLVATGEAMYFHGKKKGDEEQSLWQLKYSHEELTGISPVGLSADIAVLATNGKNVYCESRENTFDWYDGKTFHTGKKNTGIRPIAAVAGKDTLYTYTKMGETITKGRFDNGEIKDAVEAIGKQSFSMTPVYADDKEIFVRSEVKKDGKNVEFLASFDTNGKELHRFDGFPSNENPYGWTVTTNYVVHVKAKGVFRIYDRATGKLIADVATKLKPYRMATITGNDVLVYDLDKRFYRVDF